ncbi:MAG: hypothetical protein IPL54_14950 [Chitinophagaceae bacterium]|nr:hypothetical protein [Chitinophagaceae bacterium]
MINKDFAIEIAEKRTYSQIHTELAAYINNLIKNDFDKLVAYLYRIDVNEEKLKTLLQKNPDEDAGNIIAALIIERQQQKIKWRKQFSQQMGDPNEEEKW